MTEPLRIVARGLAALFLLGSGLAEAWGVPSDLAHSTTPLQLATVLGEVGMVLAGIVGGAGVLLRRAWAVPVSIAWAASVVLAGGLAPRAFGNSAWSVSAMAAGVCLLVGLSVVQLTRIAVRAPVQPAPDPS